MSSENFRIKANLPKRNNPEYGPYGSLNAANKAAPRVQATLESAWKREPRATASLWIEREDENGRWVSVGGVTEFEIGK